MKWMNLARLNDSALQAYIFLSKFESRYSGISNDESSILEDLLISI